MTFSSFEFAKPRLTSVNFSCSDATFDPDSPGRMPLNLKLQHRYDEPVNNQTTVSLDLELTNEEHAPEFLLTMEYQADFRWDEQLPDKTVESMLKQNAVALLLSYARPIVATITGLSALPPVDIPFVDLTK